MPTLIALLRVSTDDQSLGLEAQRAAVDAYAASEGFQIIAYHVEDGISGATPFEQRPNLVAALSQCLATSSHMVVARRDRLARDPMAALIVERALEAKYLHVYSADGSNGTDPTSVMVRQILTAVAGYERQLIRARTKAALGVLTDRGVKLGRPVGSKNKPGHGAGRPRGGRARAGAV